MKIIQNDGDIYIKADDLIDAIRWHSHLVKDNHAISDPEWQKSYDMAHEHIIFMIEGELKSHKEANNAGNNNNSDNLCNIGDDLMDKQEKVRYPTIKISVQIDGETHYECNLQESNKEK